MTSSKWRCAAVATAALLASRGIAVAGSETEPGWIDRATAEIQRAEYRFSRLPTGELSAPNRAHGLRARLDAAGLVLTSRERGPDDESAGFTLRLALTGWGRAADLRLDENGARAVLERPGLAEWYVNDERGLEQGFTMDARPDDATGRVALTLSCAGNLAAFPAEDGRSVLFRNGRGEPVLRYGNLAVRDAAGRELAARLEVGPGTLRIVFDDTGATYPVTIDPLASAPSTQLTSGQGGSDFGVAVSTAGDVNGDGYSDVVVGARYFDNGQTNEGRAFVFMGSASGVSTTAAWTGESNLEQAYFGTAVSTAGDVNGDGYDDVLVGADNWFVGNGYAYVYAGSASGLGPSPVWTGNPGGSGSSVNHDRFGFAVASAGDVNGDGYDDVVVGAWGYDIDRGRIYLYQGSALGLAGTPSSTRAGEVRGDRFAYSVSGAGDVDGDGYDDVVVGAYLRDVSGFPGNEGAAYVFNGSSSGISASASWSATSSQPNAYFGWSVGAAGDVNGDGYGDVVVGSIYWDNGQQDEGRADLFLGSAAGLSTSTSWTVESDQAGAQMGFAVGTAGDIDGDGYADVIVAAPYMENGSPGDEGLAFVYKGTAAGLSTSPIWTREGNFASGALGYGVAAAGDVDGDGYGDVIVGAPGYEGSTGGRAFVFHGSAGGLTPAPVWARASAQSDARLGASIASARDVNGDGYSDVLVGVPLYDEAGADRGRVLVYPGSPAGAGSPWILDGSTAGEEFGRSVAAAGDVNGDGYEDIVVGASGYGNGESREGRAYLYFGSADGPSPTPSWTFESNAAGAELGRSVAGAGDVNRDGCADLILGAPYFTDGESEEGRTWVFLARVSVQPNPVTPCVDPNPISPAFVVDGNQPGAHLGAAVGTAGDVDGNGASDIVIGAPGWDGGENEEGAAFVYLAGLQPSPIFPAFPSRTIESNQAGAALGGAVASAGDVNRDGYSDLILGAPGFDGGETDEGRASIHLGGAAGTSIVPCWNGESNQSGAAFGSDVAAAGDVNGDGYADVVIGAPQYTSGETGEGRAYLFHGSASCPAAAPAWTGEGDSVGAHYGASVATGADVNGDGFADVLVGCPLCEELAQDEGRVFLHAGGGGGLDRNVRQASADGSRPIALLGRSDAPDAFRVRALGRTAAGRGAVHLEVEVKQLGVPFDGSDLRASADYEASNTAPPEIDEQIDGLEEATAYHWRMRLVSDERQFPRTAWRSIPGASPLETHFRTACGAVSAPGAVAGLVVSGSGPSSTLVWQPVASARYDVVRGSLAALRAAEGSFAAATAACEGNDLSATSQPVTATPPAGDAFWYLVRAVSCAGEGSYDSGAPSQAGSRDAGIAASAGACP